MADKANTNDAAPVTEKSDEKLISGSQGKNLLEPNDSGKVAPAVRDLPPANPLGEPVKPVSEYPNISEAGKQAAALGIKTEETEGHDGPLGETVVEHPVSPTDANPNPHGQRSDTSADVVIETDDKGRETRVARKGADMVEVKNTWDRPVHTGDGRQIGAGETMKVHKDLAGDLKDAIAKLTKGEK